MEIEPIITEQKIPYKTAMITGIILAVVLPFLISFCLLPFHFAYIDRLLYSRYLLWLAIGLLWLYAYKIEHRNFLIWKERKPDILFFCGSLIILYVLSFAASIVANIPHFLGLPANKVVIHKITLLLKGHDVIIVFTALTAGVTEELLMRGYLFPRLSLLIKHKYAAIFISAIVFSLLHYAYFSMDEYIFTFLFGILTAFYYQKFRDIKVLITFHFLYDIVALFTAQHFLK